MAGVRSARVSLQSGAVLGIAVASIVGIAGLVQWDLRLMLIGLLAGLTIVVTSAIVVALRHWHARNTAPGATYLSAEDVVRLRSPRQH